MILYILYRIGEFLALKLPIRMSYRLAYVVALIKYAFSPRDRRSLKRNLELVLADKSSKDIARISRLVFVNFAKYLVDFFRYPLMDREYIIKNVTITNRDYIDQALSLKKGAIAISAHLGNWELGAIVYSLLGYKMHAVVLKHRHRLINDFFTRQRTMKGLSVIELGMAVRRCFKVLEENEMLAMLGDRDFTNHGFETRFFSKNALIPKGPAAFSLKKGAPLVPTFLIRNKDNSFTLYIEKPIYPKESGDFDKDLEALTQQYLAVLEKYIKMFPDQWYVFRYIWANGGARP